MTTPQSPSQAWHDEAMRLAGLYAFECAECWSKSFGADGELGPAQAARDKLSAHLSARPQEGPEEEPMVYVGPDGVRAGARWLTEAEMAEGYSYGGGYIYRGGSFSGVQWVRGAPISILPPQEGQAEPENLREELEAICRAADAGAGGRVRTSRIREAFHYYPPKEGRAEPVTGAVSRLRSLKALLGPNSPEVRGWAPAVRRAAQDALSAAIQALTQPPPPAQAPEDVLRYGLASALSWVWLNSHPVEFRDHWKPVIERTLAHFPDEADPLEIIDEAVRALAASPTPPSEPASSDRKDAERYRWLRAEHARFDPLCHVVWKENGDRNGSEWVNTAVLDAAIDAAMNPQEPTP